MQEKEIVNEKQNSVKFSINAKGQWSGELKVYAATIEEALQQAVERGENMEEFLKQKNDAGAKNE